MTCARRGALQRRTRGPGGLPLGLKPGEEFHHGRRQVGVVMDNLPRAVFAAVDVRDALLESLNRDSNPGVRVEAVNLLVRSLEIESSPQMPEAPDSDMPMIAPNAPAVALTGADPSVRRVIRALEELQHRDPNRYVRLRSAAALRQIGPPDVQ